MDANETAGRRSSRSTGRTCARSPTGCSARSSEADDAVQEAWLRLSRAGRDGVDNLGGWLTTVVARVCLDMLRSRERAPRGAARRPHVPDPVVGRDDGADPEQRGRAGRLGRAGAAGGAGDADAGRAAGVRAARHVRACRSTRSRRSSAARRPRRGSWPAGRAAGCSGARPPPDADRAASARWSTRSSPRPASGDFEALRRGARPGRRAARRRGPRRAAARRGRRRGGRARAALRAVHAGATERCWSTAPAGLLAREDGRPVGPARGDRRRRPDRRDRRDRRPRAAGSAGRLKQSLITGSVHGAAAFPPIGDHRRRGGRSASQDVTARTTTPIDSTTSVVGTSSVVDRLVDAEQARGRQREHETEQRAAEEQQARHARERQEPAPRDEDATASTSPPMPLSTNRVPSRPPKPANRTRYSGSRAITSNRSALSTCHTSPAGSRRAGRAGMIAISQLLSRRSRPSWIRREA